MSRVPVGACPVVRSHLSREVLARPSTEQTRLTFAMRLATLVCSSWSESSMWCTRLKLV